MTLREHWFRIAGLCLITLPLAGSAWAQSGDYPTGR